MDLNPEVEYHICRNVAWNSLPTKIKEIFGNSSKGYDKAVAAYSVRNQLRFSDSLIKTVRKDEGKYYEEVISYSKERLMLYPYHLSDRVVKGLRITPFQYYCSIMEKLMDSEKSYDALPNFTAADCLRLLGIGRNQYIDLMNQYRSSRKLFRKRPVRDLLPTKPIDILIEPWFYVQVGYLTEDDVASSKQNERKIIDNVIDNGPQRAGALEYDCVHSLYRKGLIFLDVPIDGEDYIVVPPLEGFVMNRVLGDYFETLLYKIFVSIDEHTTVDELSSVLDIDAKLIKNAVSLYCRLGFAYKKNLDIESFIIDPTWKKYQVGLSNKNRSGSYVPPDESLIADELSSALKESDSMFSLNEAMNACSIRSPDHHQSSTSDNLTMSSTQSTIGINNISKRIAFLYDSTLTAFLMMGNLSPGLKNHAVTMFEVGKMADESLDSFLLELEQISWNEGEGEAQRYFEHAKTLKKTILFLRNNLHLGSMTLDLLRCESLLNLDSLTLSRLLNKNYAMLVSMAPLSHEVKPIYCENIPHLGPPVHQINSIWFKLFLYSVTNSGPPSLLLSRGTILTELPEDMEDFSKYLVTSWGHDPGVIPGSNALFTLNDALCHSAILVQTFGLTSESATVVVPFPFVTTQCPESNKDDCGDTADSRASYTKWTKHPAIIKLSRVLDLESSCGYITMMNVRGSSTSSVTVPSSQSNTNLSGSGVVKLEEVPENDGSSDEDEQIMFISGSPCPPPSAEPKNGFKDDKCAKIYREELDSVMDGDELDTAGSKEIKLQVYDSRQQKIESLRLDLALSRQESSSGTIPTISTGNQAEDDLDLWYEDWTLLDCHFGIPLFDAAVNQTVSERIVSNKLWDERSLENLVKSNKELAKNLVEFISTHQPPSKWNEETPLPSKNFYCHDGRLQEFKSCN